MKLSIEEQIQKYTNEWAIKNGGMPFLNVKVETLEGIQTRGFYHDMLKIY